MLRTREFAARVSRPQRREGGEGDDHVRTGYPSAATLPYLSAGLCGRWCAGLGWVLVVESLSRELLPAVDPSKPRRHRVSRPYCLVSPPWSSLISIQAPLIQGLGFGLDGSARNFAPGCGATPAYTHPDRPSARTWRPAPSANSPSGWVFRSRLVEATAVRGHPHTSQTNVPSHPYTPPASPTHNPFQSGPPLMWVSTKPPGRVRGIHRISMRVAVRAMLQAEIP